MKFTKKPTLLALSLGILLLPAQTVKTYPIPSNSTNAYDEDSLTIVLTAIKGITAMVAIYGFFFVFTSINFQSKKKYNKKLKLKEKLKKFNQKE